MVKYRRNYIAGGTYFFTVTLKNRNSNLLVKHIHEIKQAMQEVKASMPYKTLAAVILPDHLHTIWQLPDGDNNYSSRWRRIKSLFTQYLNFIYQAKTPSYNSRSFWQSRFWEHTIKNEDELINHINYIHYNSVKHGLTDKPYNWPHSSFKYYVMQGTFSKE